MSREPRFTVEMQVDCATRDAFLANRVTNISRGGVFIDTRLPLDSEVELRFTLPDRGITIGARGRVVWNYDIKRGSMKLVLGSGIRFTEMEPAHRVILDSYLQSLARPSVGAGMTTAC